MYKIEDKLFSQDMFIDNLQRCYDIALKEIDSFESLGEAAQAEYRFPYH